MRWTRPSATVTPFGSKTIRVAQGLVGFQSPRDFWGTPGLTWNGLAEVAPAE